MTDGRWQADTCRLEHRAAGPAGRAAQHEPLAVLVDLRLLQSVEVANHVCPLHVVFLGRAASRRWRRREGCEGAGVSSLRVRARSIPRPLPE